MQKMEIEVFITLCKIAFSASEISFAGMKGIVDSAERVAGGSGF